MTTNNPPVILRDYQESDLPFVVDSWLNSHMKSKSCIKAIYEKEQRKLILAMLSSPKVTTEVLVLDNDEDHIIGFICYQGDNNVYNVLHYVYVKAPFRNIGIGKNLVNTCLTADKIFITHINEKWNDHLVTNRKSFFNPYLLNNINS